MITLREGRDDDGERHESGEETKQENGIVQEAMERALAETADFDDAVDHLEASARSNPDLLLRLTMMAIKGICRMRLQQFCNSRNYRIRQQSKVSAAIAETEKAIEPTATKPVDLKAPSSPGRDRSSRSVASFAERMIEHWLDEYKLGRKKFGDCSPEEANGWALVTEKSGLTQLVMVRVARLAAQKCVEKGVKTIRDAWTDKEIGELHARCEAGLSVSFAA